MIFLLPSLEELASAGRGLEAFVGRQTPGCQAPIWPAASFLPGEAAPWGMADVMSGDSTLCLACGGSAGSLPPHSAPGLVGGPQPC